MGPACFLWDFLRRSDQSGYFLSLNGDIGGAAVAGIVSTMCQIVCEAVHKGGEIHCTILNEEDNRKRKFSLTRKYTHTVKKFLFSKFYHLF